jgi:NAD(P)-dependent dehydrogenase (short-subunit alcohol dehydrogenase family)
MNGLLEGKVAIVTGAACGIGRAIAIAFLDEGASVVTADIQGEAVVALASETDPARVRVHPIQADVTSKSSIEHLLDEAVSRFGTVDILVNNAGGGKSTPFMEITEAEWDAMFELNVKSVFLCCQAVLRIMLPRRSGKIINMASAAGRSRTQVAGPHYGASKAGVIGLTRNLAREVGPHGINVNAICPGIVGTERLMQVLVRSGRVESEAASVPLRRLGAPLDIAGGALFLASHLSDYMTGAMLDMNGGILMV